MIPIERTKFIFENILKGTRKIYFIHLHVETCKISKSSNSVTYRSSLYHCSVEAECRSSKSLHRNRKSSYLYFYREISWKLNQDLCIVLQRSWDTDAPREMRDTILRHWNKPKWKIECPDNPITRTHTKKCFENKNSFLHRNYLFRKNRIERLRRKIPFEVCASKLVLSEIFTSKQFFLKGLEIYEWDELFWKDLVWVVVPRSIYVHQWKKL